jgi:hypothetical protein
MMNLEDIQEFRTTWNNEVFFKNKSAVLTAKRLIKKSIVIGKNHGLFFDKFFFCSLLSSNTRMSSIKIY